MGINTNLELIYNPNCSKCIKTLSIIKAHGHTPLLINYLDVPLNHSFLKNLVSKVKEFIYLLEDLKPEDLLGLNKDELKDFLKEQLRNAYDIKEAQVEQTHPGIMRQAERFFILQQLDTLWREHLQSMDSLRESVGLRGYGQKDPLIEYKNEGYDMFLDVLTNIRRNVIYSMFMFQPGTRQKDES